MIIIFLFKKNNKCKKTKTNVNKTYVLNETFYISSKYVLLLKFIHKHYLLQIYKVSFTL